MLITSAALLCLSVLVLIYACYLDRLLFLTAQLRAARQGYMTIVDVPDSPLPLATATTRRVDGAATATRAA